MPKPTTLAPEWFVSQWFNTATPLTVAGLRGRVIALHAFQMLCPGCVSHGLPQAQRLRQLFDEKDVAVIGLHTVFEHHDVMKPDALQVFLHEYRLGFPVGVDEPSPEADGIPRTMRLYQLRGTPSLLLIDRHGQLRHQGFGAEDDLQIGALIGGLL